MPPSQWRKFPSGNIKAVFIPETAAERLAEAKAAQGGYYTRDQIHNLELGNLVLDVDATTGQTCVGVQLQETSDLTNPDWQPVDVQVGDLDVGSDGTVGIRAPAKGRVEASRRGHPRRLQAPPPVRRAPGRDGVGPRSDVPHRRLVRAKPLTRGCM